RSGEQTGQMSTLLISIADFLDEENEVVVRSLTSIIEPVILIVLGVMVGFVALSMFLPLFELTAATTAIPAAIDAAEARRIGDVLFRRGFVGRELVLAVPDERLMTADLELPPR